MGAVRAPWESDVGASEERLFEARAKGLVCAFLEASEARSASERTEADKVRLWGFPALWLQRETERLALAADKAFLAVKRSSELRSLHGGKSTERVLAWLYSREGWRFAHTRAV